MALQDLTPQLRTRLSRVERAVGWFVFLATALLVAGFVYYVYHTAQRKGWFTPKFKYQTSLNNAAGLKVGDPVKLMGFTAGEITEIIPNAPDAWFGVTINFAVLKPHYGYIWDDSKVKVSSDLLGNRFLEITKGKSGVATILEDTNRVPQALLRWKEIETTRKAVVAATRTANPGLEQSDFNKFDWIVKDELNRRTESEPKTFYTNLTETYWISPEETAALNERLERVASQIEQALPNILDLTNKIAAVLENSAVLTSNLNAVALSTQPLLAELRPSVTNLHLITDQIQGPGALGEWLIPTNINQRLDTTLGSADEAVASLTDSLENLANLTSNLNAQVQANTNMLSSISKTVVDADDLVQGLKRHWLLRSAFKTNAPAKLKK
jgi:ABC-type transporter Mla subunit MlaD